MCTNANINTHMHMCTHTHTDKSAVGLQIHIPPRSHMEATGMCLETAPFVGMREEGGGGFYV